MRRPYASRIVSANASGASSGEKWPAPGMSVQRDVGEEVVEPVAPLAREERVVLGPQHAGRRGDPIGGIRGLLGEAHGDAAGAAPVPVDRGDERAGRAVVLDERVEVGAAGS